MTARDILRSQSGSILCYICQSDGADVVYEFENDDDWVIICENDDCLRELKRIDSQELGGAQ